MSDCIIVRTKLIFVALIFLYTVIVDQLLMRNVHVGDAMLRAVDVGYLETVKKICEYAMKLPVSNLYH